jgi:hypothetical protein
MPAETQAKGDQGKEEIVEGAKRSTDTATSNTVAESSREGDQAESEIVEAIEQGKDARTAGTKESNPAQGESANTKAKKDDKGGKDQKNAVSAEVKPTGGTGLQPYKAKPAKPRPMAEFFAGLPQTVFVCLMFHAFMHGTPKGAKNRPGPFMPGNNAQNFDLSQTATTSGSRDVGVNQQRRNPNVRSLHHLVCLASC